MPRPPGTFIQSHAITACSNGRWIKNMPLSARHSNAPTWKSEDLPVSNVNETWSRVTRVGRKFADGDPCLFPIWRIEVRALIVRSLLTWEHVDVLHRHVFKHVTGLCHLGARCKAWTATRFCRHSKSTQWQSEENATHTPRHGNTKVGTARASELRSLQVDTPKMGHFQNFVSWVAIWTVFAHLRGREAQGDHRNFQTTKKQRRRDSWIDSYFDILPPK